MKCDQIFAQVEFRDYFLFEIYLCVFIVFAFFSIENISVYILLEIFKCLKILLNLQLPR